MGRLCSRWNGPPDCGGFWKGLILPAAAIMSSCLPPALGQNPVLIAVDPQDPVVGGDVTLSAQVALGSFPFCSWYRGSGTNEPDRILNVVPNSHPVSIPGPASTGRETGRVPCSLHITFLMLNDTGPYTVLVLGVTGARTGTTSLQVSESAPSNGLSGGAIAGIVIACVVGVGVIGAIVYFLFIRNGGRTEQHLLNGTPSHNQGVPDNKPTPGDEDIQYSSVTFNANPSKQVPPSALPPENTVYSEIKKK
uniref:Immunoglobulin V-set domain-containing protein n=1 Tax=Sphenodon punctatus TaxID=8508 RepID=A0A8D0HK06_SPHPU